jgi:hypothetical protein
LNHFDQRFAEKELGRKADEAEGNDKQEQKEKQRADFGLHAAHSF